MIRTKYLLTLTILIGLLVPCHSKSQSMDLSGTWRGGLGQSDKRWIFDMTLSLTQSQNTISGTSKIVAKDGSDAYAIHTVTGQVNGNIIYLTDQGVTEEDNHSGEWSWCKKKYVGSITIEKDNLIFSGDWKNDGYLYFQNKQLLENSAYTCYPGNFNVSKVRVQNKMITKDSAIVNKVANKKPVPILEEKLAVKKTEPIRTPLSVEKPDSVFLDRTVDIKNVYEIGSTAIKLKFYDNGQIDDDTISVYFNRVLILDHQRLSGKAIEIEVLLLPNSDNELLMFANNLGSIPPNTALLTFNDGEKKREITIDSNTMKSGAIVLKRKI